jgi:YidC/Oxa1 family membrane protein insertase
MQDQGKRLLITVALALGVMLVWTSLSKKDEPPTNTAGGSAVAMPMPVLPQIGPPAGPAEPPRAAAAPLILPYGNLVAQFSSECGGLKSWQLIDKRYEKDATKGYILPERSLMTKTDAAGKKSPVGADETARLPVCGAFEVNFTTGSTFTVPQVAQWQEAKRSPTEVSYTYTSPSLVIVKEFTVLPDQYLVRMKVSVTVHAPEGGAHQQLAVTSYAFQDPSGVKEGSSRIAARVWSSSTMREGAIVQTDVDGVMEWPRFEPAVQWSGFEHPYLLDGYAPRLANGERVEKHTRASKGVDGLPPGFMRTDLLFPSVTFPRGDSVMTQEVVGYLGPKNYDDLAHADSAAGFQTGFGATVDLGWFGFIGRPLLWLLQKFHDLVGNWGFSIILLTFLVKGLTLFWTTRSMRSMKAMASLAPQMKGLQSKYGEDKQRLQAEQMALYKQHGVNPVAGCLPILLQMPIWLALYRMLSNAGELYQQPFIPGWISDLTATDPFYVLPVLLVITMFVQARLQPASVDSTQQKFMQYGMPLMFGAFSFVCPAGLTIYMFTNTVLSALHSIYMNKFDKKSLAIAEQLKRNQELVSAAASPVAAAKSSAKGGAAAKAKAKAVAKPVIDAKATEVLDDTDDDGEAEEASGDAGASGTGPARNRPRRKKRRR